MKQLKLRQVCFIFIAFIPVTKLYVLPSALSRVAGNDLWISVLINIALDILVVAAVLFVIKKNENKTFYDILELNFGKVTARVIMFFYALYFLVKVYAPIAEQKFFVRLALYEINPRFLYFAPFFLLSFYACLKGIRSLGRSADLMIWFTAAGLLAILGLSFSGADFGGLLPVAFNNSGKIFEAALRSFIWFGEGAYLLFFMGKFKYEKHSVKKVSVSFVVAGVSVAAFMLLFYSTFGSIAVRQHIAVSKIARYSPVLSSIGRMDYIAVFLLVVSTVYALCIPVTLSVDCLSKAFDIKNRFWPALAVNVLLFFLVMLTDKYYEFLVRSMELYLMIPLFIFGYLIPFILIFLKKGRKNEQKN